jgi:hypothetical protein
MKKIIKLTEGDLEEIIKRVISEQTEAFNILRNWWNTTTKPSDNSELLFDGSRMYWYSDGKVIRSWKAESGSTFLNTPPKEILKMIKGRYFMSKSDWSIDPKLSKDFGPIPPGEYYLNGLQESNADKTNMLIDFVRGFYDKIMDPKAAEKTIWGANYSVSKASWGYYRCPIVSKSGTKTYGRDAFYVHGGAVAGSHGCIDLTSEMEDFAKFYTKWMVASKKRQLPLKVKYKSMVWDYIASLF